jgi:molybdopterin converting factor subunit 1
MRVGCFRCGPRRYEALQEIVHVSNATEHAIQVRLFARAREVAQTEALLVRLPAGATVGDLRRQLARSCPRLAGLLERSALAVNDEFADNAQTVPPGAEVALLPPVSGG